MNTNKIVVNFIAMILCFATLSCANQKEKTPSTNGIADSTKAVENIKKQITRIDSVKDSMEITDAMIYGKSSEGGRVKGYYSENELMKIAVTYFYDMGRTLIEYYFEKGKAIFIKKVDQIYDMPIAIPDSKVEKTREILFYVNENEMVNWEDNESNEDYSFYKQEYAKLIADINELKKTLFEKQNEK
ncbi:MAG: hypothetical protein GF401_02900 [Chitinivibrionales bacterium]|nr:hypothetical protein [Chitinivibrionales bacterium]